jgi:carboxypeptidase PM20D1
LVGSSSEGKENVKCTCGAHAAVTGDQADAHAIAAHAVGTPEALEDSKAAFLAFHALLEKSFPLLNKNLEKHIANTYSLVYVWRPPAGTPPAQGIGLAAHQDVVPAADAAEWSCPPFSGEISNGYVKGRGAIDDKQAVIAICAAVEDLLERGFQPKVPVLLLFGHDEEIGGYDGAKSIADLIPSLLPDTPKGVKPLRFILDEGLFLLDGIIPGMKARVAAICVAEKGHVNVEITANKPAGHSSTPPDRNSSIGILAKAISRIEEHNFPVHLGLAEKMFSSMVPFLPLPAAYLFANFWLFGGVVKRILGASAAMKALVQTTTAVTIVKGGYKSNVLPPSATALVNHRIHPDETVSSVVSTYHKVLKGLPVIIQPNQPLEAAPVSSTTSAAFSALGRTVRSVFHGDIAIAPSLMLGNTDTRWYWALADDIYRHCPTELKQEETKMFHGRDERIRVDSLGRLGAFFAGMVVRCAGN